MLHCEMHWSVFVLRLVYAATEYRTDTGANYVGLNNSDKLETIRPRFFSNYLDGPSHVSISRIT